MNKHPRCFISYSHDNEPHKEWVLDLATRLMSNGVDVILDQWDLYLGSDLPSFMEGGLSGADRVIAICSENYVNKANQGVGGVGYEKMILTADLMNNINSNRVIPIIRSNESEKATPTFLSSSRPKTQLIENWRFYPEKLSGALPHCVRIVVPVTD